MRFGAPVRVGWFRLSFCVADSDDKDIDNDDKRFSSLFNKHTLSTSMCKAKGSAMFNRTPS